MATPIGQHALETTVNAFLLGIGIGTLLAIVVKPRESAGLRLEIRDKSIWHQKSRFQPATHLDTNSLSRYLSDGDEMYDSAN
jgi:hypothetical protein